MLVFFFSIRQFSDMMMSIVSYFCLKPLFFCFFFSVLQAVFVWIHYSYPSLFHVYIKRDFFSFFFHACLRLLWLFFCATRILSLTNFTLPVSILAAFPLLSRRSYDFCTISFISAPIHISKIAIWRSLTLSPLLSVVFLSLFLMPHWVKILFPDVFF